MRLPLTALALLPVALAAQSLGGLPGTLDWQALRGDSVTLISTRAGEGFARRALTLDEALIGLRPLSLGERIEPVDVVVQPVTVVPNGFVGLAPFRSYLYATPPQQHDIFGTTPWEDILAVHEYRHVEQFANLRRGWTRVASAVAGDAGWGTLIGLSTPNWFTEGDAVYAETALTYSGRGRVPTFTALQRAMALDSVRYRYAVARNGSLRRRVPDHYPLGYALVTHGRLVHGDPWRQVVRGAGTFWPPFYPFSRALRRSTGLGTADFYHEAYDSLAAVWRARADEIEPTRAERLTPDLTAITRFATPAVATAALPGDESATRSVFAQRRSARRIPQLVELDGAGRVRRVVADIGVNVDGALSAAGRHAVWSQLRVDPRRPDESFSIVVRANLRTGELTRLTRHSQLFSPALSSDAHRIVAAEVRVGLPAKLVLLDATTGERTGELATDFDLLSFPRFAPGDSLVVALAKRGAAVAVVAFDLTAPTAAPRRLTPWTRHTLGIPATGAGGADALRDRVFFTASFTGVANVFSAPLDGSAADDPTALRQLTEHPVGAYAPALDGDRLLYTTVTPAGDPIEVLPRTAWLERPLPSLVEPHLLPEHAALPLDAASLAFRGRFYPAEAAADREASRVQETTAPIEPYRSLVRGFSVHTWQPYVDQNEASVTLVGSNVLNDLRAAARAGYNLNERRGFGEADVTLARTWPWVSLGGGVAARNTYALAFPSDTSVAELRSRFQETNLGLAVVAPLSQTLGAYSLEARPSVGVDRRWLATADGSEDPAPTDALTTLDLGASFALLRRRAPRQILPRVGVRFDVDVRRELGGSAASQLVASAGLFLPGLSLTHGLLLRGQARSEDLLSAYQFPDFYPYARGYDKPINSTAVGLAAEYHLPLWYPDLGLWGIVYARRLRAALWADVTRARLPEQFRDRDETLSSVGVDLTLDAVFFNVQALPVGLRLAYRLDDPRFSEQARGWAEPQLLVRLPL